MADFRAVGMINGHIFTEKLETHHGKAYQTVIDDPPHGTTAGLCNVIDRHGSSIIFRGHKISISLRESVVSLLTMSDVCSVSVVFDATTKSSHPSKTELLDDKLIRHLWHCPNCKARFKSFPRFPKGREVSERGDEQMVDVFPPLNGT